MPRANAERFPTLLTVDEVADLLRTTRRAIYAMVERRQLPGVIRLRRRVLLRAEIEWDVIDRMPCTIRLLRIPKGSAGFYDFDEYERLVEAAK